MAFSQPIEQISRRGWQRLEDPQTSTPASSPDSSRASTPPASRSSIDAKPANIMESEHRPNPVNAPKQRNCLDDFILKLTDMFAAKRPVSQQTQTARSLVFAAECLGSDIRVAIIGAEELVKTIESTSSGNPEALEDESDHCSYMESKAELLKVRVGSFQRRVRDLVKEVVFDDGKMLDTDGLEALQGAYRRLGEHVSRLQNMVTQVRTVVNERHAATISHIRP